MSFMFHFLPSRAPCIGCMLVVQESPSTHDMVVCMDGGKSIEREFFNNLVRPDGNAWDCRNKAAVQILYDEDSINARKTRSRGLLNLCENMYVYTASAAGLDIPKKKRVHLPGSTHGLAIQGAAVPAYDSMFMLPRTEKSKVYGPHGKILAGGSTPGAADVPRPEFANKAEPLTWHGSDIKLYEEILSSLSVKAVFDATAADATLARACMKLKIAYVGLVWTQDHRSMLTARLTKELWQEYITEGSPLYQPSLAALLTAEEQGEGDEETGGEPEQKKRKTGGAAKPKPKTKDKAKSTAQNPEGKAKANPKATAKAKDILAELAKFTGAAPGGESGDGEATSAAAGS